MSNMNSPPPPYSASEGVSENQAAPEDIILSADEHPITQPSPPPYTARVTENTYANSNPTGYELRFETARGYCFWQGPINISEACNVDIPDVVCRQLANSLEAQVYYSIVDPDGQIVDSGTLISIVMIM